MILMFYYKFAVIG